MGSVYVLVMIAALSLHCSVHVVAENAVDASTASTLIKEGQSAEILCMTKGTGDYFWRKGESLYNSSLVAYFTVGEVSDDSQPYSVTANGTLHIKSVTLKDEGNYFCRVSSAENECYGEVKILVQASLRNFELAIDRCDGDSSCSLYVNPYQLTSLTCTALNAPPLMTLKWFNGAKEITEGIEQNVILPQNGNSRELISTVTAVYGHPASLTCQAVDPKRSNDDVRFANAQVEMTVPAHETLPSWISVSVTLAGCFIVFGIFLLIKAMINREQRKKYTKVKKEDDESLKGELKKSRNENIELQTKVAKDEANIKSAEENLVSKSKAIAELEFKLKLNEEELKKKSDENIELHKTFSNALANDKLKTAYAETSAQKYTKEITELKTSAQKYTKEITELKDKLRQQEEDINKERNENIKLQITTAIAGGENTVVEEIAERRNKEISELKKKVEQKEKEINDQREKYNDCQTNLHKKEIALQEKSFQMSDLKSKLKEKESELGKISEELANLKEDLAKKERAKEQKSS